MADSEQAKPLIMQATRWLIRLIKMADRNDEEQRQQQQQQQQKTKIRPQAATTPGGSVVKQKLGQIIGFTNYVESKRLHP